MDDVQSLIETCEGMAGSVGKYALFDVVWGGSVSIDCLMYHMLKYYVKGQYKTLVDPTVGSDNISFRNIVKVLKVWNIEYKPCSIDNNNWACRNGYDNCVCDVFKKETLPMGDVWFYDPPFVPYEAKQDARKDNYVMYGYSFNDIKSFYSRRVFENFIEKGAKLIILKGASFYYPYNTENFYILEKDIVEEAEGMKLIGRIIYRYVHRNTSLMNYMIGRIVEKGVKRLHNISTTFLIYRVEH